MTKKHFEHAATLCGEISRVTGEAFQTLAVASAFNSLFSYYNGRYSSDRFFNAVAERGGYESFAALQRAASEERVTAAQSLYLAEQIATGDETDPTNLFAIALSAVNPGV